MAVEAQEKVHYAMPVRNMLYDSLSYTDQISRIWNELSEEERKGANVSEVFSRFKKDDKLAPVITIIFYHGSDEWDGATELYQMLNVQDNTATRQMLEKYVPNYKINLLDVSDVKDVDRFTTDLHIVLDMVKIRKDKEKMKVYMEEYKEYFSHVDEETARAIRVLLHADMLSNIDEYKDEEETINMCKAFEDMIEDGRQEGRQERENSIVKNMLSRGYPLADICAIVECDEEFVHKIEMAMV